MKQTANGMNFLKIKLKVLRNTSLTAGMQSPSAYFTEKSGCTARQLGPREGFKAEKGQGWGSAVYSPEECLKRLGNDTGKDLLG